MPARPSRKPREANKDAAHAGRDVTGGGKVKGVGTAGSQKPRQQLPDAKHRVGSARGR